MGAAFVGTSGFYYSSWIGDFYPQDIKKPDLLAYYQKTFHTVEINSSFYHIPRATTVENWKSKVDKNFVFVFKASRTITHLKKFNIDKDLIDMVFTPIASFSSNPPKHLFLFQTPGNVHAHLDKLEHLLQLLPKTFMYAFEFRHDTWFQEEIYDCLKKFNAAVVLSDSPTKLSGERLWPYYDVETADFAYVRFHGSKQLYYSSYSDEELEMYASLIHHKLEKNINVYAYFNNDAGGFATKNALTLLAYLKKQQK